MAIVGENGIYNRDNDRWATRPPWVQCGVMWARAGRATIRTADNRRRRPPPPPWTPSFPLQTKVTVVAKNQICNRDNLIGPVLVHKLLGPSSPSNTSLAVPAALQGGIDGCTSVAEGEVAGFELGTSIPESEMAKHRSSGGPSGFELGPSQDLPPRVISWCRLGIEPAACGVARRLPFSCV